MMEKNRPDVLLVSVDALKPEFVFEQKKLGISLPNVSRYFVEGGTCAGGGVRSVFPTFTYPCHQSIITGVCPATHGTYSNRTFSPMGNYLGVWHWFANREVKILWEAAKENGYMSANVAFPTSVGAKGDYVMSEFWWDGSELGSLLLDAVAKPQGVILEMEEEIGRYAGGLDLTEEEDRRWFKAAMWVLKRKIVPGCSEKPFFLSAYSAFFDGMVHQQGVYSKETAGALEKIDSVLGEMIQKVHEMINGHVVVCVCSDHGVLGNQYNISPDVKLREAGLIGTDKYGRMTSQRARSQRVGGMSGIGLKDPEGEETKSCLKDVMGRLALGEDSGILEIMDRGDARARGGFSLAEYVLVSQKGYEIHDDINGSYYTTELHQKAQHGYNGDFEEVHAPFMLEGEDIQTDDDLGAMNLIDIASTLAVPMSLELPDAEGTYVLK